MTCKERVGNALRHVESDIVPYELGFTFGAREKLVTYYGEEDLQSRFTNHLATLQAAPPDAWTEVAPGYWRDQFGVVWNRSIDPDIGTIETFQLQTISLDQYEFPDPADPRRFESFPAFIAANRDKFVMLSVGFSLFERAWTLRGMEQLLVDMIERPAYVEELLDAILEWNLDILERALQFDLDGCMFGDDWGQQRGQIMGPRNWRRFLKPRLAKQYGRVKGAGKAVFIHTCGDVVELLPDLIEIGVDVFNPFQPEVMDVFEMKEKFGHRITFFGGISTQRTLPYGTPEVIRQEVKTLCQKIGRGGGFILAPAHAVPKDVPVENLVALIDAVADQ